MSLEPMMSECTSKGHGRAFGLIAAVLSAALASCATQLPREKTDRPPSPPVTKPAPVPSPKASDVVTTPAKAGARAVLRHAEWSDLPGWRTDAVTEAWPAFLSSCGALAKREPWRDVCSAAQKTQTATADGAREFFEKHFVVYGMADADSGEEGLITGYYEPLLRGSRVPTARHRHALYRVPDDLVVVDLAGIYPELKNMRLRGRLDGRRLIPYFERAEIDGPAQPLRGQEIVWVDDPVDLFFLHIQGSGRIALDTGETMRVGYAEQNGHPYRAIGRVLIDEGQIAREAVSMQTIKAWLRKTTERSAEILNTNASYVFFRELPATSGGPPGALGVPLTAGRSIAVDRTHVPLGAPVFIATTWPGTSRELNRLTMAQDTGGAIRGPVRADLFWGSGEAAEREAGLMKERLRMWVLLPHGHPLPTNAQ